MSRVSLALIFLCIAASLAYVRGRMLVVELSYDLSQKQTERVRLLGERQALTAELATLRSPARVEKVARERLGLKKSASGAAMVMAQDGDLR